MRDAPLLMRFEMAQATLCANKTETRRIGEPKYEVGQLLWVREPWRTTSDFDHLPPRDIPHHALINYESTPSALTGGTWGRYRHARFMPRRLSRMTLLIDRVVKESLWSITDYECECEGVMRIGKSEYAVMLNGIILHRGINPWQCFGALWDSINGEGSWEENPTVTAYKFKTYIVNIDKWRKAHA